MLASPAEAERLRKRTGLYLLRSEASCFIRGNLSGPAILHLDATNASDVGDFFATKGALNMIEDCEAAKAP
jgi:hypothetical protein